MKVLIHICCAPCLIGPLGALRAEGIEPAGCFYNPNIHPLLELRKRIKGLRVLMERDPISVEIDETYGLEQFIRETYDPDPKKRCERCHAHRLGVVAMKAARGGFDAFTSTLLSSPHRDHEMVRALGERAAAAAGVAFLYRDFRALSESGHDEARRRGIYLQPYCGCCFSEYERFRDTTRELYRGGGAAKAGHGLRPKDLTTDEHG